MSGSLLTDCSACFITALSEEEDFQRNRAIAAERTVKELTASLAELRANEIELLDGKASEVTARVAAEKELREEKRKTATIEEEAAGKAKVLVELESAAEAVKGEQEKEKAQKTHMETRLGMLVREMKDLREFAADPHKGESVSRRSHTMHTRREKERKRERESETREEEIP